MFDLNSGNRYTYVEDDPVNLVDSNGASPSFIACAFIAAAAFFAALGITSGSTNLAAALTNVAKAVPDLVDALAAIGINVAEKFVPIIG